LTSCRKKNWLKQKTKGVEGYLINIVHEYLKDIYGFVQIDEERSLVKEIRAGCLQGSIIGPLLFNILMSNLSEVVKPNRVISYADDSYIVVYADSDEALREPYVTKLISKTRSLLYAFRYLRRHLSLSDLKLALNAHLISRLTYAAPVWSHSINCKLRIKLRSSFYHVLRILVRDFERRLNRKDLVTLFEMEDIVQVLSKRTSVFVFKLIRNLSPFKLGQRLMMRSYFNDRDPFKIVFFDLSKTKIGKHCITNATKKIVENWRFDWPLLSLETFKAKLSAQFQTEN